MQEPTHKFTVKVKDSLRTIQGATMEEYQANRALAMADLAADLELVQMAEAVMHAAPIAAQPTPPAPAPAPAQSDWGQQAAAPAPTVNTAPPTCAHGPRNAVAKDWWKAWFCSGPRDMPQDQKCKPVFLPAPGKPGHNPQEWAAFPAVAK